MKCPKVLSVLVLFLFLTTGRAHAQVSIAPINLFADENQKINNLLISNGANQPYEISVEFLFGYFSTDAEGNLISVMDDTAKAKKYSIHNAIKAFPQNFTLQPGQRQTIRVFVRPDRDLSNGTYWARIKTRAAPLSPPIEQKTDNAVSASVGIIIEQISGLFYKVGEVNTGIDVNSAQVDLNNENEIIVNTELERLGNSPFLGTVNLQIMKNNNLVAEHISQRTIYFGGNYRFNFPDEKLDDGNYKLKMEFRSERSDVAANDLIQIEPVTFTKDFTIE